MAALPFALTSLFSMINFRIDQVMLSFMTTDAIVGAYSAAYKIIDVLAILPGILVTALYPVFSKYHATDTRLLKKTFNLSLRYVITLSIPIVIGGFLLSGPLINLVYGPEYADSAMVLKILIFISLFGFINSPLFVLLNSIDKQKITMINTAFTALANIVMNAILIPKYGIIGAAFATIVSEITFLILSAYQIRKSGIELNLLSKAYKPLISSIVMGVFVWYFISWNIFILIPVAALIYFIVLYLLKEFDKEDIDIVKEILKKRKK